MSKWGHATFFRTRNLDALERAIRDLCLEEGLVATPYVRRKRETWDRMQYGTGATSDRWALAIGAGQGGWTVVETAPFELLAEPRPSGEHRLGILARALRCEALHVSLYDGVAMAIVQAAPTGEVVLSGYTMDGPSFHGVEIAEEHLRPGIRYVDVPPSVHEALERSLSDGFDELLERLGNSDWVSDWVDVSGALIKGEEVPSARVSSFVRPALDTMPPLGVTFAVEEHPLGTRYVLDGGVWVDDGTLDAANAEVGAAFVRKVARWLDVPVSLEPGVPRSVFCVRAAPSESVRRVGVETELLSIGSREGTELLLHGARGVGTAELDERSPYQRRRLVDVLARALVGARASADAAYRGFERVVTEPTPRAFGAFAGERLVTAWWRRGRSAISIEGRELFELPGLCTAMAGAPGRVALALVTPSFVNGNSQGYGHDDAVVIVVIDVDTGEVQEVLRSGAGLTFGFTHLCFAGDVLGVQAERGRAPVIMTLERGRWEEHPGEFPQWMREALRAPPTVDDLYSSYEVPILWAGPHAIVVGREAAGNALAVLDLSTKQRRPLFDSEGLEPLASSESGSRCLARGGARGLFVGSATPTRPPSR
ncbi:hypothetical protein BO221_06735 [Archangium sp. Cb G35]|uniref:hypothetical protein n=1 Tax=Archangium sp. Cb G35 TaxID=1920190 RepID=UPI000936670F|nr:hypothetical protein [Archangium sp. Cb G35]OJT25563.1 hypothetical protein BO221_06735 [Archangium sp. Cb G35]